MSEFAVANGTRFAGDFSLKAAAGYDPSDKEAAYLACLAVIVGRLAEEKAEPAEFAADLEALRGKQCALLRKDAEEFVALARGAARDGGAESRISRANWREGAYHEQRRRYTTTPFSIELDGSPATDLIIKTFDVAISDEKQRFKVELDKVTTVLKAVLGERPAGRWLGAHKQQMNVWKLDDYLQALAGIARVGLMNQDRTQTPFAAMALSGFKDEFVAREAGLIKNSYVLALGIWAFLAMAVCFGAFGILHWRDGASASYANFLWLWAGAAAGAWLSFSIRRVTLTFDDLALLEEDRLKPMFRILFVIVLTTIVGLLFWTDLVAVTVGKFTTDFDGAANRDVAFLIGAFCGLSERSMSSAVARRADDFATSVGGAQKKLAA